MKLNTTFSYRAQGLDLDDKFYMVQVFARTGESLCFAPKNNSARLFTINAKSRQYSHSPDLQDGMVPVLTASDIDTCHVVIIKHKDGRRWLLHVDPGSVSYHEGQGQSGFFPSIKNANPYDDLKLDYGSETLLKLDENDSLDIVVTGETTSIASFRKIEERIRKDIGCKINSIRYLEPPRYRNAVTFRNYNISINLKNFKSHNENVVDEYNGYQVYYLPEKDMILFKGENENKELTSYIACNIFDENPLHIEHFPLIEFHPDPNVEVFALNKGSSYIDGELREIIKEKFKNDPEQWFISNNELNESLHSLNSFNNAQKILSDEPKLLLNEENQEEVITPAYHM